MIIYDPEHSPESLPDDTLYEQPEIADILGNVSTDTCQMMILQQIQEAV